MPKVLFVCTANRFRSPIAAACFKQLAERECAGYPWHVASAGMRAHRGAAAATTAVAAASKVGLDISRHAVQPVRQALVRYTDLVVVMEGGHKEALLAEFSWARGKVYLLSEAVGDLPVDIPDPEAEGLMRTYHATAEEICSLLRRGIKQLCQLALQAEGVSRE